MGLLLFPLRVSLSYCTLAWNIILVTKLRQSRWKIKRGGDCSEWEKTGPLIQLQFAFEKCNVH